MNALWFIASRVFKRVSVSAGTTSKPSMQRSMNITRRLRTVTSTGSSQENSWLSWDQLTSETVFIDMVTPVPHMSISSSIWTSAKLCDSMITSTTAIHSLTRVSTMKTWFSLTGLHHQMKLSLSSSAHVKLTLQSLTLEPLLCIAKLASEGQAPWLGFMLWSTIRLVLKLSSVGSESQDPGPFLGHSSSIYLRLNICMWEIPLWKNSRGWALLTSKCRLKTRSKPSRVRSVKVTI